MVNAAWGTRNWDTGRLHWMLGRDTEMSQARNKGLPSADLNLNGVKNRLRDI
jgi:hypothetical protein